MDDLNGMYVGIVIKTDDPDHVGKVQVYIPKLDPSLTSISKKSSAFVFPGNDNKGDLTSETIKKLQKFCVWASVQQPIFGGNSMGRYDQETGKSTTSNYATETDAFRFKDSDYGATSQGSRFNNFAARGDAFAIPSKCMVMNSNFTGLDYFVENYINAPSGIYSMPDVGSKVTISFLGNSKTQAIITGKIPLTREIELIND